jgi:hypothetical protein
LKVTLPVLKTAHSKAVFLFQRKEQTQLKTIAFRYLQGLMPKPPQSSQLFSSPKAVPTPDLYSMKMAVLTLTNHAE